TKFQVFWNSDQPTQFHFGSMTGPDDPAQGFSDVRFELGDFFAKTIGPYLEKIKEFNPLPQDLIDILLKPLPILGTTPLDVLAQATGVDPATTQGLKLLFQIATVVNSIPTGGSSLDLSPFFGGQAPPNAGQGSSSGGNTGPFSGFLDTL